MKAAGIRFGLGVGVLFGSLILGVVDAAVLPDREHRLSVCHLSTTEDSCADYVEHYSPSP